MKIGIGLPTAVPRRPPREIKRWAETSERLGFHSLGSIDRLVYDVLDPLVSLGVAAAATENIQLVTSVLNVGWRNNSVLLAKQLATVDLISDGRLTAGLGLGGWPEDFVASGVSARGRGKVFDDVLTTMRRAWDGRIEGRGGPMSLPGRTRPRLLIGGLVRASYTRAARFGDGWVAPLLNMDLLREGIAGVTREWALADRPDRPQILTGRYFYLGDDAERQAAHYLAHYYGSDVVDHGPVLADTLTSDDRLHGELTALARAGVDELVLYPCSSSPEQPHLLAEALLRTGARLSPTFELLGRDPHPVPRPPARSGQR